MRPVFDVLTVDGFDENAYLVGDADAGEAVVVDPGGRAEDIVRVAGRRGVRIVTILATHAHYDHVAGVDALRSLTGAPFLMHPDGDTVLQALASQAAIFGLPSIPAPAVDGHLVAGEDVVAGALRLGVRLVPGHAPGHVVLVGPSIALDGAPAPFALVGDVVFHASVGRTDLPGGDYDTLLAAIEREVLSLPDETVLYPGHGPATTVGRERRFNPFVREWAHRAARGS